MSGATASMSIEDVDIGVTVVHASAASSAMSAAKSTGSNMQDVEEKIGDDEDTTTTTGSTIQSTDNGGSEKNADIDIDKIYEGNKNFSMEVKLSDLKKRDTLGQGAGGCVFLMIHKPTKKKMALKVLLFAN
jgi:hypothetical protein